MTRSYLQQIIAHFYALNAANIDKKALLWLKIEFLDYYGSAVCAAKNAKGKALAELLVTQGATGVSTVFALNKTADAAHAAGANACAIAASKEKKDIMDGNPELYVWPGIMAAYEQKPCANAKVLQAALFGYEVYLRMCPLVEQAARQQGLYGPGMIGALAAAASAGFIMELTSEQMENALGIAGALLPMCPYTSVLEEVDMKDLYDGWAAQLGVLAAEAARSGLTGPQKILDGVKSLRSFLSVEQMEENVPLGQPYAITRPNLMAKDVQEKDLKYRFSQQTEMVMEKAIQNKVYSMIEVMAMEDNFSALLSMMHVLCNEG